MPLIDGTQALPTQAAPAPSVAADFLPAGEPSAFVRDRRRPGRVDTDNPELIALMRGGGVETAPRSPPMADRGNAFLYVIAACAVFWALASALIAAFG
jgi:hypothetical protein